MHIRDRLRTAFLQKRASQVCWRCALQTRQQSRLVQLAPRAQHDNAGVSTELDLLLGNTPQEAPNDVPVSGHAAQNQFGDGSGKFERSPPRARHDEDLDPASQNVGPRTRPWQIFHGRANPARPWLKQFILLDSKQTLGTTGNEVHTSTPQPTEVGGSPLYDRPPPKSRLPRSRRRRSSMTGSGAAVRFVRFDDDPQVRDRVLSKTRSHSTPAARYKHMRRRVLASKNKPVQEKQGPRIRNVVIGVPPSTLPVYATVDKPVWTGHRYHRVYLFRGINNNAISVSYEAPQDVNYFDEPRKAPVETRSSIDVDRQTLEETEELFQSWMGASKPLPRSTASQISVAKQNPASTMHADKRDRSSARSTFAEEILPLPPRNDTSGHTLKTVNGPSHRGPLGVPVWKASSLTQNLPHGDPTGQSRAHAARLHTSTIMRFPLTNEPSLPSDSDIELTLPGVHEVGIREHLRLWQEMENIRDTATSSPDLPDHQKPESTENDITQSGEEELSVAPGSVDPASSRDWGLVSTADKDQEGEVDVHNFLQPGDVIGLRTKFEAMLAVFIRNFEHQSQFYSMQGKWFHMGSRYISFTIPQVFSQQDLDPIMPFLPDQEVENEALDKFQEMETHVPRETGAPVLEKLQALQGASAEIYREHSERLDRAHTLVAHEYDLKEMTLDEIAVLVLQKKQVSDLTDVMLWTVHKALSRNPNFRAQRGGFFHRSYPLWKCHPVKKMKSLEQVKQWVREYLEGVIAQATSPDGSSSVILQAKDSRGSNPIPGFMRKVKKIVDRSRAQRNVTTLSGIGSRIDRENSALEIIPVTSFDKFEVSLLRSLKSWCISWDVLAAGNTWALSPMLLRATGLYEGHDLDERTGFLFLQELGVIAPWENRFAYENPNVRLPTLQNETPIAEAKVEKPPPSEQNKQPIDRLEDSLKGLRKDWGNLLVYCIDDASAQEIDDGISLERVEGEDSVFWIHVHVANPSAFFGPDSAIGRYAAELVQTVYLPEQSYPILQPKLTQEHFSLANGRPVLTLSARLTTDGEILATDITPGWIRNVKKTTPSRVGHELGLDQNSSRKNSRILKVGRPIEFEQRTAAEDPLSPSDVAELRILQELGTARRLKRTGGEGATRSFHGSVPNPHVYLEDKGIIRMFNPYLSRQFIGDPTIAWEAIEVDMTGELSRDDSQIFVADIMILAGEVAGRWCSERNIPVVYRGTIKDPAPPMTPEAYKANVIDRTMQEKGYVPIMFYRAYNRTLGQSTSRSSPFPHAILGTEMYTKATSPLRRYTDMLAHWQIQSALLHEARHGKGSLINSPSDSYLPFSRAALDALIPTLEIRERAITDVTKRSTVHWIMQLLHRAFYFGEAQLPESFDLLVHAQAGALLKQGNALGYTKQLSGIDADLLENEVSKREGGIEVGDWWECRIEGVDTYGARLRMWPVRLTARDAFGVR